MKIGVLILTSAEAWSKYVNEFGEARRAPDLDYGEVV